MIVVSWSAAISGLGAGTANATRYRLVAAVFVFGPAAVDLTEDFFSVDDGVLDAGPVGESVLRAIFSFENGEAAGGKTAGGDEQGAFAALVHGENIPFRQEESGLGRSLGATHKNYG